MTVNVLAVPGAVKVPAVMLTAPLAAILPLVAVKVPLAPSTDKVPPTVNVSLFVEIFNVPEVTFTLPTVLTALLLTKVFLVAFVSLISKL